MLGDARFRDWSRRAETLRLVTRLVTRSKGSRSAVVLDQSGDSERDALEVIVTHFKELVASYSQEALVMLYAATAHPHLGRYWSEHFRDMDWASPW